MSASLDGVNAKIERAKGYFADVEDLIRQWHAIPENQIAGHTVTKHPEGERAFLVAAVTPPPPQFPLVVGDLVHNLRTALDHLAWQLVLASPPSKPDRETAFPVWVTNKPAQAPKRLKFLKLFKPDIASYQPYQRRASNPMDDPLYVLTELDNIDKHRLVLVVPPNVPFTLTVTSEDIPRELDPDELVQKEKDDKIIFTASFPLKSLRPKSNVNVQSGLYVLFKDTGLCCDGQRVLPTLDGLIKEVETVVNDFSRFF
jgi:hypothetical protein